MANTWEREGLGVRALATKAISSDVKPPESARVPTTALRLGIGISNLIGL